MSFLSSPEHSGTRKTHKWVKEGVLISLNGAVAIVHWATGGGVSVGNIPGRENDVGYCIQYTASLLVTAS